MENEIPKSWISAKLADVISSDGIISDGDWVESKDQDQNGSVRLIQLADIGDGDFRNKSARYMTNERADALNCTFLKTGDVLVARMPDPLGRACIFPGINQDAVTVVDICVIRTTKNSALSSSLINHWINSPTIRGLIAANASGTTRQRITRKKLEEFELPIPPVAEQKVIAEKLNALLAQVETTKARLERIPEIIKRFRQSVLAAAVSGRLTEEWRGNNRPKADGRSLASLLIDDHKKAGGHAKGNASNPTEAAHDLKYSDIPKEWGISFLKDICIPGRPITYGILKPGPELETGVPYIRVADFPGNKLNLNNIKKTSKEIDEQFKRARLQEGDLLLSIRGSVGRLIKIPKEINGANITQDTARLSISCSVSVDYIYYALLSESVQRRMNNAVRGVAVRGINIGDVRALQIPMPSFDEQTEIVRRVKQLFAFADTIEQNTNAALERVNNLTQSILAKAFRGELTAEWRAANPDLISGENSAVALLERIKTERASATKKYAKR